jgi:hypothetical protein
MGIGNRRSDKTKDFKGWPCDGRNSGTPPKLNGVLDDDDALMVAQFAANMNVGPDFVSSAADANLDNTVDIVDALFIAQYTAGLVDMLPYAL